MQLKVWLVKRFWRQVNKETICKQWFNVWRRSWGQVNGLTIWKWGLRVRALHEAFMTLQRDPHKTCTYLAPSPENERACRSIWGERITTLLSTARYSYNTLPYQSTKALNPNSNTHLSNLMPIYVVLWHGDDKACFHHSHDIILSQNTITTKEGALPWIM